MSFYIEKAIFINRAPFEHLELNFNKNSINVLSAINGKGKTTILSHIADAFYEMARNSFWVHLQEKKLNIIGFLLHYLILIPQNIQSYILDLKMEVML